MSTTILMIIAFMIAILPTVVIMVIVISNARAKREPFKKVASVFTISAISVIPAGILEVIGGAILALVFALLGADVGDMNQAGTALYSFFELFFVVGVFEEACKYFTFKWMIFNDRDFDNTYDGIIYGACSALGFATIENLMYVFLNDTGPSISIAVFRAIMSVPMHAVTGIYMGYYFGISKYRKYNNVQADTKPERKAFIFSVLLHGFYDFVLTLISIYEDNDALVFAGFGIMVVTVIFIYVTIGRTIHRAKKETHNIYNRYYYEQLGGMFQDMRGGKTTHERRIFGMPLPRNYRQPGVFNPYNPYGSMGMAPPPPQYVSNSYIYGTQQPYNPYYQQGGMMQPAQQPARQQYYGSQQGYAQQPQYQQNNGYGAPQQQSYNNPQSSYNNSSTSQGYVPYVHNGADETRLLRNGADSTYVINQGQVPPPVSPAPSPMVKASAMKVCQTCGEKNSRTAKFCKRCGGNI